MPRALDRQIREMIADGTGLPQDKVIPANGNWPRPKGQYATVLPMRSGRLHRVLDNAVYDEDQDVFMAYASQTRRTAYSVIFYQRHYDAVNDAERSPFDLAEDFQVYTGSLNGRHFAEESTDPTFRIVIPLEDIRNLDNPVGDKIEYRAGFDLEVDWLHLSSQDVGIVDNVEITLRVEPPHLLEDEEAVITHADD